jgi:lysophospholipase L1-like esterase
MVAFSWQWFGHSIVFVVLFAALLVPGIALLYQWKGYRPWAIAGFVAGALLAGLLVNALVSKATFISIASWLIRHRLLTFGVGIAVVAVVATVYFTADVERARGAMRVVVRFIAILGGLGGGILIGLVFIIGTVWIHRYWGPVGVNTSVPPIQHATGRYVALGDSYSAGEGLGPFLPGAGDPPAGDNCHRSKLAYSQLLSIHTRPGDFRACSGAVASEVFDFAQYERLGKQVTPALLGPDVGLVTLTMGGNDMHFSDVLQFCGRPLPSPDCLDTTTPFNPGPPDSHEPGTPGAEPLEQWANQMLVVLHTRLDTLFTRLRTAAPNARIIVFGYPRLLPVGHVPRQFDSCDDVLAAFNEHERAFLANEEDDLNQVIFEATKAARIEFIDPAHDFSSHEACGPGGALINDTKIAFTAKFPYVTLDRGAFHPVALGQRVLARELACYLNDNAVPPDAAQEAAAPGSDADPLAC